MASTSKKGDKLISNQVVSNYTNRIQTSVMVLHPGRSFPASESSISGSSLQKSSLQTTYTIQWVTAILIRTEGIIQAQRDVISDNNWTTRIFKYALLEVTLTVNCARTPRRLSCSNDSGNWIGNDLVSPGRIPINEPRNPGTRLLFSSVSKWKPGNRSMYVISHCDFKHQ